MVPYHDEEESIDKLYEYYYENAPRKKRVAFMTIDRKHSAKKNFPIGFYTASIGRRDILFTTVDEEDFDQEMYEEGDGGFFNLYI